MALTPLAQAQSLAARPELERLGPSKLAQDPGSFKTMLTSQLGVSNQVFGSKPPSLVSPLANLPGLLTRQEGGKGLYTPSNASQNQSQSASGKSGPVVRGRVIALAHDAQALSQSGAQAAARGDTVQAQSDTAQQTRTRPHHVRGQVIQAATKVDPEKDDLGHLPGPGSKGALPQCFTKEEEDLLFAAASAESRFLAAKRRSSHKGKSSSAASGGTPRDGTGALCAAYESGGSISAIGYDGRGGTSYGLYQIASGVGTMNKFLQYLDDKAPELATRLENAGPANSGGRHGGMAQEWKRISAEQPQRFEALQHDFIRQTHYIPALRSITLSTGTDVSTRSQAVREVLWSTAVQHGPNGASDIFEQALDKLEATDKTANDKDLIEEVYAIRLAQFSSRSRRTRSAVSSRLADEKQSALAMLDAKGLS
ncbi:hypothetical protein JCM15519_19170 [Fundidesulfovibrio butyratiphilus]